MNKRIEPERGMTPDTGNEELWQQVFGVGAADLLDQRGYHSRLPSPPRCRLCKAPFKGLGGLYLRFKGKSPAKRNPNFCNACDIFLENNPGGANVPMSILYADIRKSTEFVRTHPPAEVARRINKFLELATREITDNDGFLVAFYGDCVVANWPPGFSGEKYVQRAVDTAKAVAAASKEEGIPVGIGVHMGEGYMCSVEAAKGSFRDVSIFGEIVNLVARLSDAAGPGELLVSAEVGDALGLKEPEALFEFKGFDDPVRARRL